MRTITSVIDSKGKLVQLGRELGRGGEGSVYEVGAGGGRTVAKIYHQTPDPLKQKKIATMVGLRTEALLRFATWPLEELRHPVTRDIVGFLMPRLVGKEIHKLYGPKTRLREFPAASYPFLVHTAANLARAFAAVHESGHRIGDVNHGNFYVSSQATVMLVDCDSFQIAAKRSQFRCEVGVPMYQPPELQEIRSFRDVIRTENHDNFGLAVFIFLLLFMGRHPFSGRFAGSGDMPIERAIKECRFVYGSAAASLQMQPPPATLPLSTVPASVAALFERAFSRQSAAKGQRPQAREWVQALDALAGRLSRCPQKEGHRFADHLQACPWCELERKFRLVLFPSAPAAAPAPASAAAPSAQASSFNLAAVWAQVLAIPAPGTAPELPAAGYLVLPPSAQVFGQLKRTRYLKLLALLPALLGIGAVTLFPAGWLPIGLVTLIAACGVYYYFHFRLKLALLKTRRQARAKWETLRQRWSKDGGAEPFANKLKQLEACREEHQRFAGFRRDRIRELEQQQQQRQLLMYLQPIRIEDAKIDGIGQSRKATLASYGIETAADVMESALRQVPGFGPSSTKKLLAWRQSLEAGFRAPAAQSVPPAELAALERELAARLRQLEQELADGPGVLRRLAQQVRDARGALRLEADDCIRTLAQVEADLKAL
ncbi:hypothetical protein B5M42_012880 [Paenibacillus athensensis]|uniref:Protein kinase domain-containing protein n=1 Tax=Paenibacillus athensensis TaxID=1967502 RepID=A0A4Y8Q696_9BACL|nr:hypothetical protein [Paenibacillus athensensis]MCD1259728.1 hypothetical protein [Paenibacillus athensensis]